MSRPDRLAACRGALTLRRFCLPLLASAEAVDSPATPHAPPAVAEEGWRLFLAREGCATALQNARVAPAPPVLRRSAVDEACASLAARAQIEHISRALDEAGLEAVVLKGGLTVALGGTVALADLDLLVAPDRARTVARLLERVGVSAGTDLEVPVGGRGMTHLASVRGSEGVPIEVHFDLHWFQGLETARSRATSLPGFPGLRRFRPGDHVRHLVVHSALQHPERCGRFRDLLLIRDAIRECSADEIEHARRRLPAGAAGDRARALLELGAALAPGRAPTDPFRRTVAAVYLLAVEDWYRRPRFGPSVSAAAVTMAQGPSAYGRLLRDAARPWELESSIRWVARAEQAWPRLGRWVRTAGSVTRLVLASVPAAWVAWRARSLDRTW